MDKNIKALKPKEVWAHFDEICKFPRPSKHEEKISKYIQDFAKSQGIECIVDKIGNVILRKPATKGMENRRGVIMQAHMDMVPQKNSDKVFDFVKDPIEAYIDGEWVTANGTTLGADNGMGLAATLAVFGSKDLAHGPIEALITVDEETGMTGAFALEAGIFHGDILLNLDSEDEGELYVGCAGGLDANASVDYKEEKTPANVKAYELNLKGLKGGHSGMEIILQRGNSNKLMIRFLKNTAKEFGLRINSMDGGGLRNAIPRESYAKVVINAAKADAFLKSVAEFEAIYKSELAATEDGMMFTATPCDVPSTVIDLSAQTRVINMFYALPNGIIRMSDSMHGLVETSVNLAHLWTENGKFKMIALLRSSVNTAKYDLSGMMASAFELAGADYEFTGAYDGWKPNMESPILKSMLESYKALYGKTPAVKAIHAGLECGILGGIYPNWDMISFGPTIRYPHSPDEKVNIESVNKFWDFLINTLKNAPLK